MHGLGQSDPVCDNDTVRYFQKCARAAHPLGVLTYLFSERDLTKSIFSGIMLLYYIIVPVIELLFILADVSNDKH